MGYTTVRMKTIFKRRGMDRRSKILIVDDMEINREILRSLLEDSYDIIEAADGVEAIQLISENWTELSVILLDLVMPKLDGFQVLEYLKSHEHHLPVIIITANGEPEHEKRGLSMGAVDFIAKPFDPDVVRLRVNSNVKLKNYQEHLEILVEQQIQRAAEIWASVLQSMADIIETRNLETGSHVKRTTLITRAIASQMNKHGQAGYYFTPKQTRFVFEAASLHDVGKIGIPDAILLKPGALTDDEFRIMQNHTIIGKEIAEKITQYAEDEYYKKICKDICFCHHERWDGAGYPSKLKGAGIPLAARIVAVADTYDAITNDRPYRQGRPHEVAVKIISEMSGSQFDPTIIDAFLEVEKELKAILSD